MTDVNFISYNVRGLNSPEKRHMVLREMERYAGEIIFLQETHIALDSNTRLYSRAIPNWYYGDSPNKRAKGVAIGVGKNISFMVEERRVDPEGRYLFLKGILQGKKYTLANVYCPNRHPKRYLKRILNILMDFKQGHVILAGDFNFSLEHELDNTSNAPIRDTKQLKLIKKKLYNQQLVDPWRIAHPATKDYTFYSSVHDTYSRLDYIFVDHGVLEKIVETLIGIISISDHAPVIVKIRIKEIEQGMGTWNLNKDLIENIEVGEIITREIEQYFKINNTPDVSTATIWEAHKAYIRGKLISIGSGKKKARELQMKNIIKELQDLEHKHKKQQKREIHQKIIIKRDQLRDLMEEETRKIFSNVAKERYKWGNKPGKHLARLSKVKKTSNYIEKIKNQIGEMKFKTSEIANIFKTYYSTLYSIRNNETKAEEECRKIKIQKYLQEANLPTIPCDSIESLEDPITQQEINNALRETPGGKSAGPDGFPIEYYKRFKEKLVPELCNYFNKIGEEEGIRKESLLANISVIPKIGKDGTICSNYRPIALLNADIKIYAKILATRLKNLMPELINTDQVGFVTGREGRDNSIRTLLLMSKNQNSKPPVILMSIDAEKAFDRVDWGFMMDTLRNTGMGPRFLKWISNLYSHPTARVKVNGKVSPEFEMFNGTRQGCPLSPLLYIISLEPLLAKIRNNPDIGGVRVGKEEHKVAAYADDILLYLTKPRISLPNVIREIKEYGELSNFKINPIKTVILNLGVDKVEEKILQKEFPFAWETEALTYLGIKITTTLDKLYPVNFIPLINEIKLELKKMERRSITWIGRINAFKMMILPKITYKFQMLPIEIPQSFFKVIKKIISKYIWQGKRARVNHALLSRKKKTGGLALPDIQRYYKAVIVARLVEWANLYTKKKWVNMENTLSKTLLYKNIWIPPKTRILGTETHSITKTTFKIWDIIHRREKWEYSSPLIPLAGTNFFIPGNGTRLGKQLGLTLLKDITTRGRIKIRQDIKTSQGDQSLSEWEYLQLTHFVNTLPQPIRDDKSLNPMEKLCSMEKPLKHGISQTYEILTELETQGTLVCVEKWGRDMGKKLEESQMIRAVFDSATDITTIEANYKCMLRWHLTPEKMNKIHPNNSPLCWRNCKQKGTTKHIWWECPKIKEYWADIIEYIEAITGEKIPQDPWICLFHGASIKKKQYKRSLIPVLLNAAKGLIPKKWLEITQPTIGEWILRVDYVAEMEYLGREELGGAESYRKKWEKWRAFKLSARYAQRMIER